MYGAKVNLDCSRQLYAVLAAVLITCGPDNANAQVSGTDGMNTTATNIINANTSSSNTGTEKGKFVWVSREIRNVLQSEIYVNSCGMVSNS